MPKGGDAAKRRKKSATRPRSIVARAGRAPRPSIASEPRGDLSKLLAEPRRMKILAWLQEEGSARVRDLRVAFGVSEATIKAHVSAILQKLGVESRTQAVIAAAKIAGGQWRQGTPASQ